MEKPTLSLQTTYVWKNLDGSEPEPRGFYYAQESLNPAWGSGFDSEEHALEKLSQWLSSAKSWERESYVLHKVYSYLGPQESR